MILKKSKRSPQVGDIFLYNTIMSDTKITLVELKHIAKLARLYLTETQEEVFLPQIESILEYFANLDKVNTNDTRPTYQVTGQKNILREDIVDTDRMFTQAQALSNAPRKYQGYFVTSPTISKK